VERAFIVPPGSQLGPLTEEERRQLIESSDVHGHYEKAVDRESAYEKLKSRVEETTAEKKPAARQPQTLLDAMTKSAARSIGSELGRRVLRGVLGSILGGKRR
jgi:DNA helicase HerA-like ATPase